MRKIKIFSAVLSLFQLVPASIIWAQNILKPILIRQIGAEHFVWTAGLFRYYNTLLFCTTTKNIFYETS